AVIGAVFGCIDNSLGREAGTSFWDACGAGAKRGAIAGAIGGLLVGGVLLIPGGAVFLTSRIMQGIGLGLTALSAGSAAYNGNGWQAIFRAATGVLGLGILDKLRITAFLRYLRLTNINPSGSTTNCWLCSIIGAIKLLRARVPPGSSPGNVAADVPTV